MEMKTPYSTQNFSTTLLTSAVSLTSTFTSSSAKSTPLQHLKEETDLFRLNSTQILQQERSKHTNAKWIDLNKLWNYAEHWSQEF